MNIFRADTLRRLIPAFVVGGVVVFSLLAQVPSLASSNDVGYGYRNNCGVKGDGFHDHGKVCPNRPFPGHGHGVLRILGLSAPQNETQSTSGHPSNKSQSQDNVTQTAGNGSSSGDGVLVNGPGHGKGHGKGKGLGHNPNL
jgi:hypothetical protein